jgi:hypothetical protein
MTIRMLFRGLLFYVGILLFFFSSFVLFVFIKGLMEKGIVAGISTEASDSAIQIAILKNGFETLIAIGLVIISILLMSFFKDWDKEEPKN